MFKVGDIVTYQASCGVVFAKVKSAGKGYRYSRGPYNVLLRLASIDNDGVWTRLTTEFTITVKWAKIKLATPFEIANLKKMGYV